MKTFTPISTFQCPQCGYELPLYFKYTKLVKCVSCQSTIFLEDGASLVAGESSVLVDEPSLLKIGREFQYNKDSYMPVGKVRYSYGRGFWEEWWLKDNVGRSWWMSVDEGDFVLERLIDSPYGKKNTFDVSLGDKVGDWIVSELGTGVCDGFEGSLPKEMTIGAAHEYIHLSSHNAKLRTIEVHSHGVEVYDGQWISPFDISLI